MIQCRARNGPFHYFLCTARKCIAYIVLFIFFIVNIYKMDRKDAQVQCASLPQAAVIVNNWPVVKLAKELL